MFPHCWCGILFSHHEPQIEYFKRFKLISYKCSVVLTKRQRKYNFRIMFIFIHIYFFERIQNHSSPELRRTTCWRRVEVKTSGDGEAVPPCFQRQSHVIDQDKVLINTAGRGVKKKNRKWGEKCGLFTATELQTQTETKVVSGCHMTHTHTFSGNVASSSGMTRSIAACFTGLCAATTGFQYQVNIGKVENLSDPEASSSNVLISLERSPKCYSCVIN